MQQAEIIQLQQKPEAKFMCSACGADRGCDCNAPALEKLANIREKERQAKQRQRERQKTKEINGHVPPDNSNNLDAETSAEQRKAQYDDAPVAIKTDDDDTEKAAKFNREILKFLAQYQDQILPWLERKPRPDDTAKDALMASLYTSAESLMRWAQQLDNR